MNFTGFLFDLDGVLIDSEREYSKIWNAIESKYPTGQEKFALKIKGQTLNKILEENYPEEIRHDVSRMLHELESEMTYTYCEGAESFLDFLNSRCDKIALVTSSDGKKMAHLYSDIPDFKSKVNVIIDSTKVKKSKPDPEGYLLAAKELGLDIRDCVVFEDSVQGVRAGRASGAFVVGIAGTKTREELEPYSDIVVDSLSEVRDILELHPHPLIKKHN